jgi:hypothetical protein
MPSQPNASTDTLHSLALPVAQAMRELADRLSALYSVSDREQIDILSTDLKRIGWNSLFVSSSIDNSLQFIKRKGGTAGEETRIEFSRQLDSLLVAAKYFESSVKNLKELELAMPDRLEDHQDAYACLAEKLWEILRECQRSAN